jgi:hypothetical protein
MRCATAALVGLVRGIGAASAGCTDSSDDAADPQPQLSTSAASASPDVMPLSLLVFNVEYSGSNATDQVMADVDAEFWSPTTGCRDDTGALVPDLPPTGRRAMRVTGSVLLGRRPHFVLHALAAIRSHQAGVIPPPVASTK